MLLSASEIISRTWKTFTTHFTEIAKFMLVFGLFFAGVQGLRVLSLTIGFTGNILLLLAVFFLASIAAGLFIFWLKLALVKSLGEVVQNQRVEGIISALKSTGPLFLPAFGASILVGVLVFFGTLLLVIPGVIFAVWYIFTTYNIIFEKKGVVEAMKMSKVMVVGRWWGVAWRIFIPPAAFILSLILLQALLMSPLAFLSNVEPKVYDVINVILSAVVTGIFTPLSVLAILILYFNLRENPQVSEPNLLQK